MPNETGKFEAGRLVFYDKPSGERVLTVTQISFYEEFNGAIAAIPDVSAPIASFSFVKKTVQTVGVPTVGRVQNAPGGAMQLALDATSEKQEATLYFGDEFEFDATKLPVFEARVRLSVLPSAAPVQAVWGVSSAWADGPDNAADYIEFGATGNGAILLRSQDGVIQNSAPSGTTVLATDWHIYRISCLDPAHVDFTIDGGSTGFPPISFAAIGASAVLQPYFSLYKASGPGVGTMQVDYVRFSANRS